MEEAGSSNLPQPISVDSTPRATARRERSERREGERPESTETVSGDLNQGVQRVRASGATVVKICPNPSLYGVFWPKSSPEAGYLAG